MGSKNIDVYRRRGRHGAWGIGHCNHDQCRFENAKIRTAYVLGHGNAQPSTFSHRLVESVRELSVAVELQPVIVIEPIHDRAYTVQNCALLLVELKIHN